MIHEKINEQNWFCAPVNFWPSPNKWNDFSNKFRVSRYGGLLAQDSIGKDKKIKINQNNENNSKFSLLCIKWVVSGLKLRKNIEDQFWKHWKEEARRSERFNGLISKWVGFDRNLRSCSWRGKTTQFFFSCVLNNFYPV